MVCVYGMSHCSETSLIDSKHETEVIIYIMYDRTGHVHSICWGNKIMNLPLVKISEDTFTVPSHS